VFIFRQIYEENTGRLLICSHNRHYGKCYRPGEYIGRRVTGDIPDKTSYGRFLLFLIKAYELKITQTSNAGCFAADYNAK